MKINRILALVVIALLMVAMSSAVTTHALAQTPNPDTAEDKATGPDTDNVEEQVGEQVEDGQPDGVEAPGTEDNGNEAGESASLAGQAKISAEEAKAAALAANPGASVAKVELDNENGSLVYSVELSNGTDVKVDAGNGAVLHTETGADKEK
jgi:uncharacterized membrane protein YkoI